MALPVGLGPSTRMNGGTSHSAAHDDLHAVRNAVFINGAPTGIDSSGAVASNWTEIRDGSDASPLDYASGSHHTMKITRSELYTSTPNPFDAQYNANLYLSTRSMVGNKQQPTALYATAVGHSQDGNFVLVGSIGAFHTSGASNAGAQGLFVGAQSTVVASDNSVAVQGIGFGIENYTGRDTVSGDMNICGLDIAIGANNNDGNGHNGGIAGNGWQVRGTGTKGAMTVGYASGKVKRGIDLTGLTTITDGYTLLHDATAVDGFIGGLGGDPFRQYDTNDYFAYSRGLNEYIWYIGGSPYMALGNWTPSANQTPMYLVEGVAPTLRQVKWKDGASIGAGDKVLYM